MQGLKPKHIRPLLDLHCLIHHPNLLNESQSHRINASLGEFLLEEVQLQVDVLNGLKVTLQSVLASFTAASRVVRWSPSVSSLPLVLRKEEEDRPLAELWGRKLEMLLLGIKVSPVEERRNLWSLPVVDGRYSPEGVWKELVLCKNLFMSIKLYPQLDHHFASNYSSLLTPSSPYSNLSKIYFPLLAIPWFTPYFTPYLTFNLNICLHPITILNVKLICIGGKGFA